MVSVSVYTVYWNILQMPDCHLSLRYGAYSYCSSWIISEIICCAAYPLPELMFIYRMNTDHWITQRMTQFQFLHQGHFLNYHQDHEPSNSDFKTKSETWTCSQMFVWQYMCVYMLGCQT